MPRFGRDKDSSRKEELDRQAAEEVERLTRRGGPPGMGGGGGMPGMPGMGSIGIPSPLERIAEEVRDAPRPSMRRQAPPRRPTPQQQQAFTPLPSGGVGSSFGPGGLNPGPRGMGAMGAPPPPAFTTGYDDDYGGPVSGPPVYNAEPDEEEEMTITGMALMDHAERRGYNPEDLVMRYDATSAEEMRDAAMRKFYERQQSRQPSAGTNNPFAPAGMRGGPSSGPAAVRRNDPASAGSALAARLANKRRREEEEARRAQAGAAPKPEPAAAPPKRAGTSPAAKAAASPAAKAAAQDDGAVSRLLARRRQALLTQPEYEPEPEPEPEESGLRAVPLAPAVDGGVPSLEDMATATAARRPAAKAAKAAPAAKAASKARATKATKPATTTKAPAAKAPAAKKAGATLAKPAPAAKGAAKSKAAAKAPAAKKVGKAKTVFCIECGEKNPAIAKFCFNCGTRLAAPET